MSANNTPTRTTSSRDDVLQFLDSLDTYSAPPVTPARTSLDRSRMIPAVKRPVSTGTGAATAPPPLNRPISAASTSSAPSNPNPAAQGNSANNAQEAQSVLDFLDEITQRSSTPTAPVKTSETSNSIKKTSTVAGNPTLTRSTSRPNLTGTTQQPPRRSTESVRSNRAGTPGPTGQFPPSSPARSSPAPAPVAPAAAAPEAGWGWSSMWNQASSVVQQASNVVQQAKVAAEEQVKTNAGGLMKALGENEQAKKFSEGVLGIAKTANLDQLGKDLKSSTLRSLTELLNAVAPPIAEHEVIQVSLSHDMIGYDGVETLVYRALAKIMEQIEGGSLIVNNATAETQRRDDSGEERELNSVQGLQEGWKLAEASLEHLIKTQFKPVEPNSSQTQSESSLTVPVTNCPIYMRIQPVIAPLPYLPSTVSLADDPKASSALFFQILLRDPTHKLIHSSLSQSIPASWLEIPFEENEWVEDVMVDVIRRSVECIGQEYISHRMRAQTQAISKAREEAQRTLDARTPEQVAADETAAREKEDEANQAAAMSRLTV